MILEYALVQLMEDVGGYACEYVGMRQSHPEWREYRSKTLLGELWWILTVSVTA
jgi:hypothetical protein